MCTWSQTASVLWMENTSTCSAPGTGSIFPLSLIPPIKSRVLAGCPLNAPERKGGSPPSLCTPSCRDQLTPYEAFPSKKHLLKPFQDHGLSVEECIFSSSLWRAQTEAENAFSLPANWFRVFNHRYCSTLCQSAAHCFGFLHNFLRTGSCNLHVVGLLTEITYSFTLILLCVCCLFRGNDNSCPDSCLTDVLWYYKVKFCILHCAFLSDARSCQISVIANNFLSKSKFLLTKMQ